MVESSAVAIAYDLRPAKQTQRRMILTLIECAREAGMQISQSRYIGMGGFKFYDFVMIYRFSGITDMVSLEYVESLRKRCYFNRPYSFIKLKFMSCSDYLQNEFKKKPSVVWFDYDSPLSSEIVDDIKSLASKLVGDSLVFVTVDANRPEGFSDSELVVELENEFGELASGVNSNGVEESTYRYSIALILSKALKNSFITRSDWLYHQMLNVAYRDTSTMVTCGGVFAAPESVSEIRDVAKRALPFLDNAEVYDIKRINISEPERHRIEYAVTKDAGSKEEQYLRSLGISQSDIDSYRDLVRFLPRYVEAIR